MLVHFISGADIWQSRSPAPLGVQVGNQLSGATTATSCSPSACPSIPGSCWVISASCLDALPAYPETSPQRGLINLAAGGGERLIPLRSCLGWKHPPANLEAAKSRGAAPLPIALGSHGLQPHPLVLLPWGWSSQTPPSPPQAREAANITQGHGEPCQHPLVLPVSRSLHQSSFLVLSCFLALSH